MKLRTRQHHLYRISKYKFKISTRLIFCVLMSGIFFLTMQQSKSLWVIETVSTSTFKIWPLRVKKINWRKELCNYNYCVGTIPNSWTVPEIDIIYATGERVHRGCTVYKIHVPYSCLLRCICQGKEVTTCRRDVAQRDVWRSLPNNKYILIWAQNSPNASTLACARSLSLSPSLYSVCPSPPLEIARRLHV